jgi:hypothetical protein
MRTLSLISLGYLRVKSTRDYKYRGIATIRIKQENKLYSPTPSPLSRAAAPSLPLSCAQADVAAPSHHR